MAKAKKDETLDTSVGLSNTVLAPLMSDWIDSCVKVDPEGYAHVLQGRKYKRKNLYTSFISFLWEKNLYEKVDTQQFTVDLECVLKEKKIQYYKNRRETGLVLHGLSLFDE